MLRRKAGSRPRRRSKFGVAAPEQRTLKGQLYDSKLEMRYAMQLELLRNAVREDERVVDIKRQVSIKLEVNGVLICRHIVDFVVTYADGRIEYHEVKGYETDTWRIKHALFKALFPHCTYRVIRTVR